MRRRAKFLRRKIPSGDARRYWRDLFTSLSSRLPLHASCLFLLIQLPDKPALVELGDEARIDKLFRLMTANIRSCLGDVIVGRFQTFGDRVWRGNKILLVDSVGPLQKFRISGFDVLC